MSSSGVHQGAHPRPEHETFICENPKCNQLFLSWHTLRCHQRKGSQCSGYGALSSKLSEIRASKHIVGGGLPSTAMPKIPPHLRRRSGILPRPNYAPDTNLDHDCLPPDEADDDIEMGEAMEPAAGEWPPLILRAGPPYTFHGFSSRSADDPQATRSAITFSSRFTPEETQMFSALKGGLAVPHTQLDASKPMPHKRNYLEAHYQQVKKARKKVGHNSSQRALFRWISEARLSHAVADDLLKLIGHSGFHSASVGVSSMAELQALCSDSMPDLVGTHAAQIQIAGSNGRLVPLRFENGQTATFHFHNMWEQALLLFSDPAFKDKIYTKPHIQHRVCGNGSTVRMYNTFASGLLYQAMCESAPPNHLVLAPCLYSDESSMPFPNMTAYPIYCESFLALCCFSRMTVVTFNLCTSTGDFPPSCVSCCSTYLELNSTSTEWY